MLPQSAESLCDGLLTIVLIGDPTNETSRFTAKIEMKDGDPIVTWEPDLNENGTKSERLYKVYGRESLGDDSPWQYPTNSLHRFTM